MLSNCLPQVVEPAKRLDRMSWMLIGAATTLAHELGIFNNGEGESDVGTEGKANVVRRIRVRMLLYVYASQLAMRLGCTTLLPENSSESILERSSLPPMSPEEEKWNSFMTCWLEMTKLLETATDMFFPSAKVTRKLLLSGRYRRLPKHFGPLLDQSYEKANDIEGKSAYDVLAKGTCQTFNNAQEFPIRFATFYSSSISISACTSTLSLFKLLWNASSTSFHLMAVGQDVKSLFLWMSAAATTLLSARLLMHRARYYEKQFL